jgi:hypothetical protein
MENEIQNAAAHDTAAFFSLINNRFKLSLFLLKSLPAGYFSGLKVTSSNSTSCTVSIPFRWFTKNPFRSTYFACLSMAAELSTGILAMAHVHRRKPSISMLVTGIVGKFHKKATGITLFTCNDGDGFSEAIETAIATGQSQEVEAYSVGVNSTGEVVAEFTITWSFKAK